MELEPEEFEADLSVMFDKLAREVKLPGFRKGKAPRRVLENRLGRDYTRTRAIEEALPKYYSEAVRSNRIDVIAEPKVELTSEVSAEVMTFEAVVEVRPEVQVAGYGSLRVEVPNPDPTEQELMEEINRFREHFGTLEVVNRPAQEKDRVSLNLNATYNGEPFPPFESDDYTHVVGSNSTGFEDFDKHLTGSQTGHIFEFNTPHPQEEGALVRVKALVKEVQQNNLPELTDEFVEESSEFDSVDELKDEFSQQLTQAKRQHSARAFTQQAEDSLNLLVDEQLPEALISNMTQQAARNLLMSLQSVGMDLPKYLEATNQSAESFSETMRIQGEKMAKLDVALRAVAKAEGLEVSDDEVYEMYNSVLEQQKAQQQAASGGGAGNVTDSENDSATDADKPPMENLEGLRVELLKRNALEWICRNAEIVDETGKALEYEQLFPESEEDGSAGGSPEVISDGSREASAGDSPEATSGENPEATSDGNLGENSEETSDDSTK